MQPITAWLKVKNVKLYLGGDPEKGQAPIITVNLDMPQVIIDPLKNTITIIESK